MYGESPGRPQESPGRPLKPLRLSVSSLGSRDTVLGLPGQPVKAARPSTAVLGPLKLQCLNKIGQQIAVGIWVSYVTSCYVTSCSVCPGSSVAWGEGGVGRGCDAVYYSIRTIWDHIYTNAFCLYTLSQIISKWQISCCMCYSLTKYPK